MQGVAAVNVTALNWVRTAVFIRDFSKLTYFPAPSILWNLEPPKTAALKAFVGGGLYKAQGTFKNKTNDSRKGKKEKRGRERNPLGNMQLITIQMTQHLTLVCLNFFIDLRRVAEMRNRL